MDGGWSGWTTGVTHTADDLVMVGQVGLADLAAVDALGVQVDVVGEAHPGGGWALGLRRGNEGGTSHCLLREWSARSVLEAPMG